MSTLTPASVLSTLATIGKEIDTMTETLRPLGEAEVEARLKYKRAFNQALFRNKSDADGKPLTADLRRSLSELETLQLEAEWKASELALQEAKDKLKALRDRLEIGRSLSPIMRLEWGQN